MVSDKRQRSVELSSKQRELYKIYPDPCALFLDYNPSFQHKILKSRLSIGELSYKDIPTLGLLNGTYGEETPLEWLKIHIGSLNDYAEQSQGITEEQLQELCHLILGEYYYLNLAELSLFFAQFKLGYYGEFYGVIGPMKIANALRKFDDERRISIARYEEEIRRKRREQEDIERAKNAVSYEEYKRLKGKKLL